MKNNQKVLFVDTSTSYYRVDRFKIGEFFGPVDLGMHLSSKYKSLNIGIGLLAGSIFPGSNRLIITGRSPAWDGFYISSMGGAGLVFHNLGINMLSLIGKASSPSILYLNRRGSGDIQVGLHPIDVEQIWSSGRGGVYSLMQYAIDRFGDRYENDPRVLAVGQASQSTDFGSIASAPVEKGQVSYVDTWAGRGGMGSQMLQEHGIAAIIYGGSFVNEDFRDRKVADKWFEEKYQMKLMAKDLDATTKYKFDPKLQTGGTLGVNYTNLKGSMLSFNYKSIYMSEEQRIRIHERFILDHYLKQFNEETIAKKKNHKNCGEPCATVCKKMHEKYKKDYEPYQTMGPLSGIFDQRAAEMLNHRADMYGFDAISVGGTLSWMMECLSDGLVNPDEFGVSSVPHFDPDEFEVVESSLHNAQIGLELLEAIIHKKGIVDLSNGTREFAKKLSIDKGKEILDRFVYNAYTDKGWMVPNQYWTPGVLSPMSIMGKYYMYYGSDFMEPYEVGKKGAARLVGELIMDNIGICRFHRGWAEEMMPQIIGEIFGLEKEYMDNIQKISSTIINNNASVYWESNRNIDFVKSFLERKHYVEECNDPALISWIKAFRDDKIKAAKRFWEEMRRGIMNA